jgi:hypothetical protein
MPSSTSLLSKSGVYTIAGNCAGVIHSKETREKLSPKRCAKASSVRKGVPKSQEHRAKLSIAAKLKRSSVEERSKQSMRIKLFAKMKNV